MSLSQEQITVEKITQYGVRANGRNYSLSPKLKEANVTPANFRQGASYLVEVWTGPQGGKSINAFNEITLATVPPPPPVVTTTLSAVPMLPTTTVAATPAPGGIPPVAPAAKKAPSTDDDKMSKADWAAKDHAIGIDAVIKSSLEAPALAQMVVGKNEADAFALVRRFIKENLTTQRLAKDGTL